MTDEIRRPSERAFADLRAALDAARQDSPGGIAQGPLDARVDTGRRRRQGNPEVVYAAGKTPDQVRAVVARLLASEGRALVSRVDDALVAFLAAGFPEAAIDFTPGGRAAGLRLPGATRDLEGGHVGIITAGTSDLPVADEARLVAEEMGCRATLISDVGVAGLHRLIAPLAEMLDAGVQALIVVAGMDGALPSVVAGLVSKPVIGLPTSTGYGMGGQGVGALLSMLQTCAPGLTVVNIDNGIGAAIAAARIANAVAEAAKTRV